MKITPAFDKIVVRKESTKHKGLIVVPDSVREDRPTEGTIIAFNPEHCDLPLYAGLKIVFGNHTSRDIPHGDVEIYGNKIEGNLAIISEGDIWYTIDHQQREIA